MKLSLIIEQLRAQCPAFSNRVAGAAEFKKLDEAVQFPLPAAYVVPLDDNPGDNRAQNAVRQNLIESFAVIVAVSNAADEPGQGATDAVHALRAELWAALLGFRPLDTGEEASRYDGIVYAGGALLHADRGRLWYQFEFEAEMEIEPADGWQARYLALLENLETVHVDVDAISPMALPHPGPDDRIEHVVVVPPTGVLPPP